MADGFNLKIKGLDEVIGNLDLLDRRAASNVEMVVKDSAKNIQRSASSAAPVDSGDYKKTIKARIDGLTAFIGPFRKGTAIHPLGHILEFGTQPHGGHPGTAAQPHLFPAFESERPVLISRLKNAIQKAGEFR